MSNKILATLAILFIAAASATAGWAQTGQATIQEEPLELQVNQVRTLRGVTRVVVGDAGVLEVTRLDDGTGVILTALKPGVTELEYYLLDEPGIARRRQVTVRARDIEAVRKEIEVLLSYMVGLQVEKAGNESLVIKGKVLERSDRDHLTRVLESYPSGEDLKIFDFTEDEFLDTEERRLQNQVENDLLEEKLTTIKIEVKNVRGSFKALLRGVAYTDRARDRAQEIAALYYEDVINLVQLEKPVIELDVVIAELDLRKTKQLGSNDFWTQATRFTLTGYLNSNFGRSSFYETEDDNVGQEAEEQRDDEPGLSIAPTISIAPDGVNSLVRALAEAGAAIVYVEQHQAVLSGESAEFADGRELTIPFTGGPGGVGGFYTVETGIVVDVTPEQKEDGTIRNTVSVENSTITALIQTDAGLAVDLDKFESKSVVECRSDETIVLAGSDTQRLTHDDQGTPYIRRIPIVNLLFRARDKVGTEARNLILVTPTSSTIRRESRQAFSIDSFRKRDFIQDESPYWERHIDWGYYEEFYERAKEPILFINSWEQTLYYDEVRAPEADVYVDDMGGGGEYVATDDFMMDSGATGDGMAVEDDAMMMDDAGGGSMMSSDPMMSSPDGNGMATEDDAMMMDDASGGEEFNF